MFSDFALCRRRESNSHPLRDTILSRARLPIPPLRQCQHSIRKEGKSNKKHILLTNICFWEVHFL